MEEIETSGIAVGAEDYKEADKLVRILTPDLGVVRAVMRGVKKEKAKLKFAAMPFAFCEYSLLKRGAFYSVKTATPVESLFGVTRSPETYIAASVMLETAAEAAGEHDPDAFVFLLTALKSLIYSDREPYALCYGFVRGLLEKGGYMLPSSAAAPTSPEAAAARLKAHIKLFENKFICKIRSAALL